MKLFIAFSVLILAACLQSPLIVGSTPRWQLLAMDKGARYWFLPTLALLWTLLYALWQCPSKPAGIVSALCLAATLRGIHHDWRYPPYRDFHFSQSLARFAAAPPGTPVEIPICPDGRLMCLLKR